MSEQLAVERGHYGYWVPLLTRWMDNDVYGHVNNVTYYSYFDTAANDYLVKVGGLNFQTSEVIAFVVASNCEYRRPVAFPDALEVGVRINRLGRSSVEYGLAVFNNHSESAAAYGTFTHVFVSRETARPVPIPKTLRSALAQLQQAC